MIRKTLRFLKWFILGAFAFSILLVGVYRFVPVPVTPLMIIRYVQQTVKGEKARIRHRWVSYEKISDNLKRAVIASEDQLFFEHRGFDFNQIKKATQENKRRRRPRGASTISQQTAKNVFLWPQSSWVRKGLEVYFTVLIEVLWDKERIMEVYLNSIEMGKGIYGAEAVAREHFKTSAAKLTRAQSALIAATLPNPVRFSSKNPSAYILRRQGEILSQMYYIALPK
ncbi:MAG: monofunctional biosynthetic peptidoglycan transglycosylase [Bacteroidales bacterium]|jgi:monofunctional biosynthetic peptidoglycan transglycosylase|nr:monofunctional biosynthetic peptidoglycan transglycosylase [Bacteroidales bacterium]